MVSQLEIQKLLCNSSLFISNLTRETSFIDVLTPCFRLVFLDSIPAIFAVTSLPFLLLYSKLIFYPRLKWTKLLISKTVITFLYVILSVCELVLVFCFGPLEQYAFIEYRNSAMVNLVTSLCLLLCVFICYKNGLVSSGCVHIIWTLRLLTFIPQLIFSAANDFEYTLELRDSEKFILVALRFISSGFAAVAVFLNCFADRFSRSYANFDDKENRNPELFRSLLARCTFWHLNGILWKGYSKELDYSDFWPLNDRDTASALIGSFRRFAGRTFAEFARLRAKWLSSSRNKREKPKPSTLFVELCLSTWKPVVAGIVFTLFELTFYFFGPLLTGLIIDSLSNDWPFWLSVLTVFGLFITNVIQNFIVAQEELYLATGGINVKSLLLNAVYEKMMRLSASSRSKTSAGEIINIISTDISTRVKYFWFDLGLLFLCPSIVIISLIFIYKTLGVSTFAGIAVMIIFIPINSALIKLESYFEKKQMEVKDERLKLMNEVLNGIKVLKLYAWEPSMEKIISEIRHREIAELKKIYFIGALTEASYYLVPFLASAGSFAAFVLLQKEELTPKVAFVTLTLFNRMRWSFSELPRLVTKTISAVVSLRRISDFLHLDELETIPESSVQNGFAVKLSKYTATWDGLEEDKPTEHLRNVDLEIAVGELVAVVGRIGSGKSSLLSAIIGEMRQLSGTCERSGTISYVPQESWIQNKTLRDNILFDRPFDVSLFRRTLQACAMGPDLQLLPAADLTQIGEKGINLSGGQKARVSLARAVYQRSEIYLLDDPISAVDSHVAHHLFDNVICGILKDTTRILVTHSLTHLKNVDRILFMEGGAILESGAYDELIQKNGKFAALLREYVLTKIKKRKSESVEESDESGDSSDIENVLKDLAKSTLATELPSKVTRRRSTRSTSETSRQNSILSAMNFDESDSPLIPSAGQIIEEETTQIGKVAFSNYVDYTKAFGVILAAAYFLLIFVFGSGSEAVEGLWLADWSEDADKGQRNQTLHFSSAERLAGYAGLGLLKTVFVCFADVLVALGTYGASVSMHRSLVHSLFRAPMSFFDSTPLGRILNRISGDIEKIDETLPNDLFFTITLISEVWMSLILVAIALPALLIPIVPMIVIVALIFYFYTQTSVQIRRLNSKSWSFVCSFVQDSYLGLSSIRAYDARKRFVEKMQKLSDWSNGVHYIEILCNRWIQTRMDLVSDIFVLLFVLTAVILGYKGTIAVGIVGLVATQGVKLTGYLGMIARLMKDTEMDVVAVERVKEYIEGKREASWRIEGTLNSSIWPVNGKVEFKDVCLRYKAGGDLVLKNLSFSVKGGEKIGIVGRTGAGKSSLTMALFRIVELHSGAILIDGVDISRIGLHDLRQALTIIPQDPVMFSGKLRMNLDPFDAFSDDKLWSALEKAHVKDLVTGFEFQLEHNISEGGGNLSVGQRQLLCLARALLKESTKILVLDEATAAVDVETDALIQASIRKYFAHCTVLTIAHRLNTIMDYDKILVMDAGSVREYDTPAALLAKTDSLFHSMAVAAGVVQ